MIPMLQNKGLMIALMVLLAILVIAHPMMAVAQGPQVIPDTGMIGTCSFITGEFHFECIPLYLAYLIRLLFSMAGGFALFQLIQGGYEYALSGLQPVASGLPDKEAAKKRITNAILGMVVVVLSYLLIDTLVTAIFVG